MTTAWLISGLVGFAMLVAFVAYMAGKWKGAADVKNKALARSVDAAKRGQEIHEDVLILDDAALDDELRGGPQ